MTTECTLHEAGLNVRINLVIGEKEARALDALRAYGEKAFLDAIAKHISLDLANKHRQGLVSLLQAPLDLILDRTTKAREAFKGLEKSS